MGTRDAAGNDTTPVVAELIFQWGKENNSLREHRCLCRENMGSGKECWKVFSATKNRHEARRRDQRAGGDLELEVGRSGESHSEGSEWSIGIRREVSEQAGW